MKKMLFVLFSLCFILSSCVVNTPDVISEGSSIPSPTALATPVSLETVSSTSTTILESATLERIPLSTATAVMSEVTVSSEPQGATFTILEPAITGLTPYSMTLASGNYTLVLNLDGYQTLTETIRINPDETEDIVVQLDPHYLYIPLEDITHQTLAYLSWEGDGQSLVYAIYDGIAEEPQNWTWWQYNLLDQEKTQLPPPEGSVSEETRQHFNLCPFNETNLTNSGFCGATSVLFESMVSDLMVFSPPIVSGNTGEELWLASLDGSNAQKIEEFRPAYVRWSNDGHWLVTGSHFPAAPGQQIHYIIATDGSFVKPLSQITGHDSIQINGLYPEFSPDGQRLAYAGSEIPGSLNEGDYNLYILDLDSFESTLVSERFGLFQWSFDSRGIYVLDKVGSLALPAASAEPVGNVNVSLFFIDLTQQSVEEHLITSGLPYHSQNSYIHWAFTPTTKAIAYPGFQQGEELGILILNPLQ